MKKYINIFLDKDNIVDNTLIFFINHNSNNLSVRTFVKNQLYMYVTNKIKFKDEVDKIGQALNIRVDESYVSYHEVNDISFQLILNDEIREDKIILNYILSSSEKNFLNWANFIKSMLMKILEIDQYMKSVLNTVLKSEVNVKTEKKKINDPLAAFISNVEKI